MLTVYVLEFLVFSFLGWIIDSGYRSLVDKKWLNAGYFQGPICPIYGFGALSLMFVAKYFTFLPVWLVVIICWLMLIFVEYLGGIFSEKVLGLKLWDYSASSYHLGGHIDIIHSFYWGILAGVFYWLIFPYVLLMEKSIVIPSVFDLPVLLLFVIVAIILTVRKDPRRFLEMPNTVVVMTIDQYKQLFPLLKKLSFLHTGKQYNELKKLVERKLRGMNVVLKKGRNLRWKNLSMPKEKKII